MLITYSLLNFVTMSSRDEIVCNDFIPKKLCSPPPKPPRRRHSDQSSRFTCSPYSINKNKQLNGNLHQSSKTTNITISSGSESLPSTWVSESPMSERLKDKLPVEEVDNEFGQTKPNNVTSLVEDTYLISEDTSELHNSKCYKSKDQSAFSNLESHLYNPYLKNKSTCTHDLEGYTCLCSKVHLSKNSDESDLFCQKHCQDPSVLEVFGTVSSAPSIQLLFQNISVSVKNSRLNSLIENDVHSNEARIQKEINNKLWQHLCSLQAKLDELQLSETSFEDDTDSHPSFSELMVDIYKAQKEKDSAIENRLNSALKQRDKAIKELEEVLQILVRSFENCESLKNVTENNKELENFFQDLENVEHPVDILRKQHILLAYLYHVKESKIQHMSNAIKLVEEEKNEAILKVKNLEKEISNLKSKSIVNFDENSDFKIASEHDSDFTKPLQAQIICACSQSKIEEGIQSKNAATSFCDNFHTFANDNYLSWIDSIDDMELLRTELKNLSRSFHTEVQKRKNAEGNCLKLHQTLNYVLEKFNASNIGVPV